jgi:hypothetical protein
MNELLPSEMHSRVAKILRNTTKEIKQEVGQKDWFKINIKGKIRLTTFSTVDPRMLFGDKLFDG